ncbi:MAG: hypothetical protein U1E23_05120 [Reyranellaceae bacterium]
MAKRVVMVGLHPDVVDYGDPAYAAFPGLDAKVLAAALEKDRKALVDAGYDAVWSLWEKKPDSLAVFVRALKAHAPEAVMIGAGVRLNPALTELFETLVNAVKEHAPQARLCFNSGPYDSAAAVRRQIG